MEAAKSQLGKTQGVKIAEEKSNGQNFTIMIVKSAIKQHIFYSCV